MARIENLVYCFRIDGSRIFNYRHTAVKSFRLMFYSTNHYNAISPGDMKELENFLIKNSLPKIDNMLSKILKYFAVKEKKLKLEEQFSPHRLVDLVYKITEKNTEFSEETQNIINFIDQLPIDEIVTPVKHISEFIERDLKASDPKFFGTLVEAYQRTDIEAKKVHNTPITGKTAWIKIIAILGIVGLIIIIIVIVFTTGMLNGIPGISLPGITSGGNPIPTLAEITQKYPTPESLQNALDSGKIKYEDLPKEAQKMIHKPSNIRAIPIPLNQTH